MVSGGEQPDGVKEVHARLALAVRLFAAGELDLESAASVAQLPSQTFEKLAHQIIATSVQSSSRPNPPLTGHQVSRSPVKSSDPSVQVVAIDWSGVRDGEKPGIWMTVVHGDQVAESRPVSSRAEAIDLAVSLAKRVPHTVVGIDFAFSFPEWFAHSLGCSDGPALWAEVGRMGEQWLAECPPPFWGKPGRKRPADVEMFRGTDFEVQQSLGIGPAPKSVFQIGGAGAVGTGSIRGMPYLLRLKDSGFSIWPFDDAKWPLCVEIYPRVFTPGVKKSNSDARVSWMRDNHPDLDPGLLRQASASEDAFDAIASALAMAAHAAEYHDLPSATEDALRIEGRIWRPNLQ